MKEISSGHFYGKMCNKKSHRPLSGQVELTYRCNLDCIHCYCKGSEAIDKELSTRQWLKILDEIHRAGCVWLTLTGGEPTVREDFLEIYAYAKKKGFLITIFTNGLAFTQEILHHLVKSPPYSIEITLNGITQATYESITQIRGSFTKVLENIKKIKEKGLALKLKSNCLKANKDEIGRIKKWTENLLGRPSRNTYYFKYDPMIYPRFNGDTTPCDYRLTFKEISEVKRQDRDIWREYQKGLSHDRPYLTRDSGYLYVCNSWKNRFFINPYGRMKFCNFSEKFSVDLRTTPFKEGFYKLPSIILKERFKINSQCQNCSLRPMCYYCPARAFLETGDEESPVPYFCKLAHATAEQISSIGNRL